MLWLEIYHKTHKILLFQRFFVYLFPGLQSILPLIERLYRYVSPLVFDYCDRAHKLPSKDEAAVIIAIIFYEIKSTTDIEISDTLILSHLKLVLQSRLQVFCSRIPDFDAPEKANLSKGNPNTAVAFMISRVEELSSYVPPQYKIPIAFVESCMGMFIPVHPPLKPRDLPACLLRRFDDGDNRNGSAETEYCCCGWISDSIPSSLLKFFGHSVRSFASYVHSNSRGTRFEHISFPSDPRHGLSDVFKGVGNNNRSLRDRMIVFSGAVFIGFFFLLLSIDSLTSEGDITQRIKLSEDQLVHLAEELRRQLFTCILPPAVTLYHEFWDSVMRGEIDCLITTNDVFFKFCGWACERPDYKTKFETFESKHILYMDLMQRFQAKPVGSLVQEDGKVRVFSLPH